MKIFVTIILTIALTFGMMCLEAWLGMLLFNWVMSLFSCALTLTFWQVFGICALLNFVGRRFRSSGKNN